MKRLTIVSLILVFSVFLGGDLYSQALIKKIKSKVEDKAADKAADKAVDRIFGKEPAKNEPSATTPSTGDQKSTGTSGSRARPTQNNEGGGLTNTPVDVKESIKSARTAMESKNYPDAKYSVKQAIQAVEIEIGHNILKSMPDNADGLPKIGEEDNVVCNGIGFAGLLIHRVYSTKDKELTVEIVNDATMLMGINMYLNNAGMRETQNDNSMKQVKYKGNPGVLQFDQSSGYSLDVPFGQSSLFIVKGVNYKSEGDFMKAAEVFDLEKIKLELGEK
jgi:hypothetical protein